MKWAIVIVVLFVTACGGAGQATHRRQGPDVVTAEWTSGDDAVLEGEGE